MSTYEVNKVYKAIQGEGFHAGTPCTIVRMQGCNLCCPFCDTKEAQTRAKYDRIPLDDLLQTILEELVPTRIVLITGGEPLLQDLLPLTRALYCEKIQTHLETNGTRSTKAFFTWVTISPKPPAICDPSIVEIANEVKWLVSTEEDIMQLMYWLGTWRWPASKIVSLQPISQDESATKICYDACIKYGWRLSLQQHKLIGEK